MKILFTLLLLQSTVSYCQIDSFQSHTSIGNLNIKIGSIIKREFIDLASYQMNELFGKGTGNVNFKILHITDAASGTKAKGLYISTTELTNVRYLQTTTYFSYIDADEIDALIKYLEFVSIATEKEEKNDVEYIFNSRDIQFVTFNNRRKNAEYIWNFKITVNRYYNNSNVYVHFKEINDLLQKLKQRRVEIVSNL